STFLQNWNLNFLILLYHDDELHCKNMVLLCQDLALIRNLKLVQNFQKVFFQKEEDVCVSIVLISHQNTLFLLSSFHSLLIVRQYIFFQQDNVPSNVKMYHLPVLN